MDLLARILWHALGLACLFALIPLGRNIRGLLAGRNFWATTTALIVGVIAGAFGIGALAVLAASGAVAPRLEALSPRDRHIALTPLYFLFPYLAGIVLGHLERRRAPARAVVLVALFLAALATLQPVAHDWLRTFSPGRFPAP